MWTRGMGTQPSLRMLRHVSATALQAPPSRFVLRNFGKVIVEIKAAIQPRRKVLTVENDGANESTGVVALLLQQIGPNWECARQTHSEVSDAMRAGQQASEDGSVRGVCNRAGCEGFRKTDTIFSKAVERRSLNRPVAITVNVVGAQRVNCHQKNIGLRRWFSGALGAKAGGPDHPQNDQPLGSLHATQTNTGAKHGNYADRAGILQLRLLALFRLYRHC